MRLAPGLAPALLVASLLVCGCSHAKPPATAPSHPSPTAVALPAAQVHRIETDLVSGRPSRLRRAVELPPGKRLATHLLRQLHGLTITFDRSTAVAAGKDQVAVNADVTAPDGRTLRWLVTLDHLHGRYVVADTRAVQP